MTSAQREHTDAQKQYDQARQVVFKRLAQNADYLNAKESKQLLEDRVRSWDSSGLATREQFVALLKQRTEAGAVVTRMEAEAINGDPTARQARDLVESTAARVSDLQRGFEASVTQDSRWVSAQRIGDRPAQPGASLQRRQQGAGQQKQK